MRRFRLVRTEDPTGVSGTGSVVEGVLFNTGTAVYRWVGRDPCVTVRDPIYPELDAMAAILRVHGHDGRTVVEWIDDVEEDTRSYYCGECGELVEGASYDHKPTCSRY